MDLIKSKTLQQGSDFVKVNADEALNGKKFVGFYFSAHWCPPCRGFTPVLKDFYEEVSDEVEIIFVSSDRSSDDMQSYMKESHGSWLSIEHGSALAQSLKDHFGVSGIPAFIVCKADGTVVTKNGRNDVQSKGPGAVQGWK